MYGHSFELRSSVRETDANKYQAAIRGIPGRSDMKISTCSINRVKSVYLGSQTSMLAFLCIIGLSRLTDRKAIETRSSEAGKTLDSSKLNVYREVYRLFLVHRPFGYFEFSSRRVFDVIFGTKERA